MASRPGTPTSPTPNQTAPGSSNNRRHSTGGGLDKVKKHYNNTTPEYKMKNNASIGIELSPSDKQAVAKKIAEVNVMHKDRKALEDRLASLSEKLNEITKDRDMKARKIEELERMLQLNNNSKDVGTPNTSNISNILSSPSSVGTDDHDHSFAAAFNDSVNEDDNAHSRSESFLRAMEEADAHVRMQRLEQLFKEIARLERENEELQSALERAGEEHEVQAEERFRKQLHDILDEKEREFNQKHAALQELAAHKQKEIESIQAELAKRDQLLRENEVKAGELQDKVQELNHGIANLTAENEQYRDEVKALHSNLDNKQSELNALQKNLDEMKDVAKLRYDYISSFHREIQGIATSIKQLDEGSDRQQLGERLEIIRAALEKENEHARYVEETIEKLNKLMKAMEKIHERRHQMTKELGAIKQKTGALKKKLSMMDKWIAYLDSEIDGDDNINNNSNDNDNDSGQRRSLTPQQGSSSAISSKTKHHTDDKNDNNSIMLSSWFWVLAFAVLAMLFYYYKLFYDGKYKHVVYQVKP